MSLCGHQSLQLTYHIQVSSSHVAGVGDVIDVSIDKHLTLEESWVVVVDVPFGDGHTLPDSGVYLA